jgi:hypothetical protein
MRSRQWGVPGFAFVAVLGALAWAPSARADSIITITKVGNPTWTVTDIHLFSAPTEPLGTVGTGTANAILSPHFSIVSGVVVPNPPDPGPYNNEIATGLARLGITGQSNFTIQNLAGTPNGIWLAYMLVPGPGSPTGSSPDFASGPIIPESTFPIVTTQLVLRNGVHFDSGLLTTQALSTLGFTVAGSSHRPQLATTDLLTADNPLGLTPSQLLGHYEEDLTLRDAQGNGYNIVATFDVTSVPEPSSLALLTLGGVALLGWRRWKGRQSRTTTAA